MRKRWIQTFIFFICLMAVFSCDSSTSTEDTDTIDPRLLGKWLEYDSTYSENPIDGILIQSDGKIWDLTFQNEEWIIDAEDLEGTFTYANKGAFKMHWTEEGSNDIIEGSYVLENLKLILIYNFTSGQEFHYYLRINN